MTFLETASKLDPAFRPDWYHRLLADEAEAFIRGEESVIAALPPGAGKTQFLILLCAYILLNNPKAHIILLCNTARLAHMMSRAVLRTLLSPGAQAINPLRFSKQTESEFVIEGNDGRASLIAGGVDTAVTGQRADYLIVDDPIKDLQQSLSGESDTIWENLNSVGETRLLPGGMMWISSTRWAVSDPSGRLMRRARENPLARQFRYINLACWNPKGLDSFIFDTKTGERTAIKPYQSLASLKGMPYSFTAAQYRAKRANLGPIRFSALYLGEPVSEEAQLFPPRCWKYIVGINVDDYTMICTSWDTSSGAQDPSANVVLGRRRDGGFTVLDVWEERLTFSRLLPTLIERYRRLYQQFGQLPLLAVEDASSGREILDIVRTQFPGLPFIASKPTSSKFLRGEASTPYTAAGSVSLLKDAPWTERFVRTMSNFPGDTTDDHIPDAFSQAIKAFVSSGIDFRKPEYCLAAPQQTEEDIIAEYVATMSSVGFNEGNGQEDW